VLCVAYEASFFQNVKDEDIEIAVTDEIGKDQKMKILEYSFGNVDYIRDSGCKNSREYCILLCIRA